MECHATGETPSKQYPRKGFVSFFTPLGVLRFRDEPTLRAWIETLLPEAQELVRGHDPKKTPGILYLGPVTT